MSRRFVLALIVASLTPTVSAQEPSINRMPTCPIEVNSNEIYEYPQLKVEFRNFRLESGPISVVPISCEPGITGAMLIGAGTFRYTPEEGEAIEGHLRAAMLRFNPKDQAEILPLDRGEKVTDRGIAEMSRHLLNVVFRHCWHSGMEALIPPEGVLSAVLYSKEHGDLLISGIGQEVVLMYSSAPFGDQGSRQPEGLLGIALRSAEEVGGERPSVRSILPGSTAAEDGRLREGDILLGIESEDGEVIDFKGMDLYKIGRFLRGPRGSKIRLVAVSQDSNKRQVYELTRQPIEVPEGFSAPPPPEALRAQSQEITLESTPPVVVKTVPEAGDSDIDPATAEIRVTFNQPMQEGSWSWSTASKETFPTITGNPKYMGDRRTGVLPVKLEPGRTYAIWVNSPKFGNFKGANGQPAVPYLLVFKTRE